MNDLYIGLMSGTSLDGVDAVLVAFAPDPSAPLKVLAHVHRAFEPALGAELLALNTPGDNELHRGALAANAVAQAYALAIGAVLGAAGVTAAQVRAVGAHGQTVRHRPGEFDGTGYTWQLLNPSLLAERCGIDVVSDLRNRDLAAGGQGAPLVPAFHRAVFARPGQAVAVLNLGGMSNLTVWDDGGATLGWDCGPGNALMDLWCLRHTGRPYDESGGWAAGGRVVQPLLARMLSEPYFQRSPPKSTGRDLFHAQWLQHHLDALQDPPAPRDVQATLLELTAACCSQELLRRAPRIRELLVCGGGAHNEALMQRLAQCLPGVDVMPTDRRGLPAQQVEACAFAWLARAHVRGLTASLPSVTGARVERRLGSLTPGR